MDEQTKSGMDLEEGKRAEGAKWKKVNSYKLRHVLLYKSVCHSLIQILFLYVCNYATLHSLMLAYCIGTQCVLRNVLLLNIFVCSYGPSATLSVWLCTHFCKCVWVSCYSTSLTAVVLRGPTLWSESCVGPQYSLHRVVFHHARLITAATSLLAAWQALPSASVLHASDNFISQIDPLLFSTLPYQQQEENTGASSITRVEQQIFLRNLQ